MQQYSLVTTQFFWLMMAAFFVALLTRRIRMPYTLALVITGLLIGIPHLIPELHLDPHLVFTVFLPPLLFESSFNVRLRLLRQDWLPITLYTFLGTVLSAVIVGALGAWLLHIPMGVAMIFGALISATDPISVISVFKRLGAMKRLSIIIESESLFNDAVAVVLFTVAMAAFHGTSVSLARCTGAFVELTLGGAIIGAVIGLCAFHLHRELNDHLIEIMLTTVVAFGSYLGADALHASGVTAVVAAGITMGNYSVKGMSPTTRLAVNAFWEYAAFVANSIIFLLVGAEASYIHWASQIRTVAIAVGIVLVGRLVVYPLTACIRRWSDPIPIAWQHVLYWAGLRGALSMALALGLDKTVPHREMIISATFGTVLFSLLVQGSTIGPLLSRLGLTKVHRVDSKDYRRLASEIMAVQAALAEMDRIRVAEAHPLWAIEVMTRSYHSRLSSLEAAVRVLRPDHQLQNELAEVSARRAALHAERTAIHEADLLGWLDEDELRQLSQRIDSELVALRLSTEE